MTQNNFAIIGVTGITGSGTSFVSEILAERGGFIICADEIAHDVIDRETEEIIEIFGHDILQNGKINRRSLGEKVFGSKSELAKLEKIIHPRVAEITHKQIAKISAQDNHTFAVIDAPLLIEAGINTLCDSVWLITATNDVRISRIISRDNIDAPAVKKRIASRNGDDFLRPFANIIIENSGSVISLRSKIETALRAMEIKKHGWHGMKVLEI